MSILQCQNYFMLKTLQIWVATTPPDLLRSVKKFNLNLETHFFSKKGDLSLQGDGIKRPYLWRNNYVLNFTTDIPCTCVFSRGVITDATALEFSANAMVIPIGRGLRGKRW